MHRMVTWIAGLALALLSTSILAQDEAEEQQGAGAEMMAAYMEMAKPGPEHQRLADLAGEWKQSLKIWHEPGGEPVLMEGKVTNTMILGGRFLESRGVSGEEPMQTEGVNIIGFDRRYGHYTIILMDSWGTYYVTAAGTFDDSSRTIVMSGEAMNPVLGHLEEYDMILRFTDKDTYVFEIVFTDKEHTKGADSFKMVEITCSRMSSGQQ